MDGHFSHAAQTQVLQMHVQLLSLDTTLRPFQSLTNNYVIVIMAPYRDHLTATSIAYILSSRKAQEHCLLSGKGIKCVHIQRMCLHATCHGSIQQSIVNWCCMVSYHTLTTPDIPSKLFVIQDVHIN